MATVGSRIDAPATVRGRSWAPAWMTRERLAPFVTGVVFLAVWEIYVRATLPDFVATPSGVVMAIPSVIGSAEFLLPDGSIVPASRWPPSTMY